jgi:hypothetical protein
MTDTPTDPSPRESDAPASSPPESRHPRLRGLLLAGLIVLVTAAVVQLWQAAEEPGLVEPLPLEQAAYVWQRQWTPAVRDAVRGAASQDLALMILVGEVSRRDGVLERTPVAVDWAAVAAAGRPAWLVVRIETPVTTLVTEQRDATAKAVADDLAEQLAAARAAGVAVSGAQLDYDCPTRALGDYVALLEAVRRELPEVVPLSITALPAWLDDERFPALAAGLDHFVLQVHSLERPETINEPVHLCRADRVARWMDQAAARTATPFYVALPTYGYHLVFDGQGRFVTLAAEGDRPAMAPGHRLALAMADPAEMLALAQQLRTARPRRCRGIAWFRLPTAADELCWSPETFAAVLAGRTPTVSFAAEVRLVEPELYEVWLTNTGQQNVSGRVTFEVVVAAGREVLAQDAVSGFTAEPADSPSRLRLTGPAPKLGRPALALWLRLPPASPQAVAGDVPAVPILTTQVEVLP